MATKTTVLMSVYNGQRFVREAIDSILTQTLANFEFLIIDDGSTDATPDILAGYRDPRIRVVTNTQNLGLVETLNKGINLARGEYIARMDCDDLSLPERLKRQVDFLDANPDVSFCGCWIEIVNGPRRMKLAYPSLHEEIRAALLFGSPIAHPTVIFRKKTLDRFKLRYNPEDTAAEDYGLWLRAAAVARFANIPEVLLRYRQHDDQVSSLHLDTQLRVASRLREKQLRSAFEEIDDEFVQEFKKMCRVFDRPRSWEADASSLSRWCLLLRQLEELNSRISRYPADALREACDHVWERLCRAKGIRSLAVWRLYWTYSHREGRSLGGIRQLIMSSWPLYSLYRGLRLAGWVAGRLPEW